MANFLQTVAQALAPVKKSLHPVDNRGGWWPIVRESFAGAWQQNVTISLEDALQYWAVFRCISLIAGDIAKMRVKLVQQQGIGGIWTEIEHDDWSRLLAKPNDKQTRIQFFRNWMESKLIRGNTYVLKERDNRGRVVALYILDPNRCVPLINEFGEVFYELLRDDLLGLQGHRMVLPASEIIHDRWNTLYHPLVGLSPLYAAGINALAGLSIEKNSARLFKNSAMPGGILTAPHHIPDETAKRLKDEFEKGFSGELAGKLAVLGDGLKYEGLTINAVDAQLIEQLKWNDTVIAGIYGVPAYMINAGTAPAYNNVEALNQAYYSQALQCHVEDIELLLDEGLEMPSSSKQRIGTEFDLDGLLRMDTATLVKMVSDGVKAGILKPDEGRARLGYGSVEGGNTPYLQEQNYSLAALAKRDAKSDPFDKAPADRPKPAPDPEPGEDADEPDGDAVDKVLAAARRKLAA